MSKKYPKFDENDPEIAKKLVILAKMDAQTADKCNSWAELYAGLVSQAFTYFSHPCKETADFAILLLMSFVMALEDLPDEGDAKVISAKINEIMVMETHRTGVSIVLGDTSAAEGSAAKETIGALLPILASFIASMRDGAEAVGPEETTEPTEKNRTLH